MANNTFQPILSQPQGASAGRGVVQPSGAVGTLLSGAGQILSARTTRKEDVKEAKKEEQQIAGFRDVSQQLIDLRDERDTLSLLEQNLKSSSAEISQLFADGDISEDERDDYNRFNSQLDKIKSARKQGILNETAFNIQARKIEKQALDKLPGLTKELNKLFGFADDAVDTENTLQKQEAIQQMDSIYGANGWGLKEFAHEQQKAVMIQNFENNLAVGKITATRLSSGIPQLVGAQTDKLVKQFLGKNSVLTSEGSFLPQQVNAYKDAVDQLKLDGVRTLNDKILQAEARGEAISLDDQKNLRTALDEEYEFYSSLVDGKDANTRLKAVNDLKNTIIDNQVGSQFKVLKMIDEISGKSGLLGVNGVLRDPMLRKALELQGVFPKGLTGTLDTAIADLFSLAVQGVNSDQLSPSSVRSRLLVTSSAIKKQPVPPQVARTNIEDANNQITDTRSVLEFFKAYNDPKISRNLVESLDTEGKALLQRTFIQRIAQVINQTVENMTAEDFKAVVTLNKNTLEAQFEKEDLLRPSFLGADVGKFVKEARLSNKVLAPINQMLLTINNPAYNGLMPTTKEVVDLFMKDVKLITEQKEGPRDELLEKITK